MMIKISPARHVLMPDIDHRNGKILQILTGRLTTDDRHRILCQQQTTGQKLVFMRATRMGEDLGKSHARFVGRSAP